jgi:hypothetical protein
MTLGDFSRAYLEQTAANHINNIMQSMSALVTLQQRMDSELAAGTLDSPDFYGNDTTADKANIVGALNEAAALYAWLTGGGQVPAPSGDPLGYGKFLLG